MAQGENYLPRKRAKDRLGEWHWEHEEFAAEFPACYALLASARMDGVYRAGASVTIFCDQGELKFVVSDRQTEQSLFGTLDPSKPLWESLEGFVRSHGDDWRARKVDPPGKR